MSTSKDIIENDGTGVKYRQELNFISMQALNADKCFLWLRETLNKTDKTVSKGLADEKKHRTAKDYITLQKTAKVFRAETHKW